MKTRYTVEEAAAVLAQCTPADLAKLRTVGQDTPDGLCEAWNRDAAQEAFCDSKQSARDENR